MFLNTNKELAIVSYEQAKKLKELGFDWLCNNLYHRKGTFSSSSGNFDFNAESIYFSAPTVALALKWFRDEKGIKNAVCLCMWSSTRDGRTRTVYQPSISGKLRSEYNTYEQAESAMLDELLELILN